MKLYVPDKDTKFTRLHINLRHLALNMIQYQKLWSPKKYLNFALKIRNLQIIYCPMLQYNF